MSSRSNRMSAIPRIPSALSTSRSRGRGRSLSADKRVRFSLANVFHSPPHTPSITTAALSPTSSSSSNAPRTPSPMLPLYPPPHVVSHSAPSSSFAPYGSTYSRADHVASASPVSPMYHAKRSSTTSLSSVIDPKLHRGHQVYGSYSDYQSHYSPSPSASSSSIHPGPSPYVLLNDRHDYRVDKDDSSRSNRNRERHRPSRSPSYSHYTAPPHPHSSPSHRRAESSSSLTSYLQIPDATHTTPVHGPLLTAGTAGSHHSHTSARARTPSPNIHQYHPTAPISASPVTSKPAYVPPVPARLHPMLEYAQNPLIEFDVTLHPSTIITRHQAVSTYSWSDPATNPPVSRMEIVCNKLSGWSIVVDATIKPQQTNTGRGRSLSRSRDASSSVQKSQYVTVWDLLISVYEALRCSLARQSYEVLDGKTKKKIVDAYKKRYRAIKNPRAHDDEKKGGLRVVDLLKGRNTFLGFVKEVEGYGKGRDDVWMLKVT
ncbi:hypothetical protein AX16_010034 [Volvariella volvacea WC 439]|nr:hypothetical protein AX16_010034 [Volvariella volvacea WC 439]